MPRPSNSLSRRRFLVGLAGLTGALLPGVALAASPVPVFVSAASAPASPPTLPLPPGAPARSVPPSVPPAPPAAPAAPERWLQNHRPTDVWADADGPRALAQAPQWSYFRCVGAQVKA